MNKQEELLKKDSLIKKYSHKPIPKFLKYIGNIKSLDEYEDWLKAQKVVMLKWIGGYLIILPFFVFLCLSALGILPLPILRGIFWCQGMLEDRIKSRIEYCARRLQF